ncbi:hypothetical protein PILCRDRAFT_89605 [Piloderma croceum F 1598]|uniref:Uncharacterized protein n=1 Tax=Piloderma croceum (strain F 1598) TaxID=765440 RepID=A0A0C3FLU7_PILCF|nr:hypothetical protein PILCRDRAFT_89605 [Piloderma croceum F 1598]
MSSESIERINAFRALVKESRSVVLQYFRECDNLRVWPWPTSAEARISPSAMQEYHISHRMLGPCCLCPMLDANKPDFIEAAIYKASDGEHRGHFVATCAKDDCGYFVCSLYAVAKCRWRDSTASHKVRFRGKNPSKGNAPLRKLHDYRPVIKVKLEELETIHGQGQVGRQPYHSHAASFPSSISQNG